MPELDQFVVDSRQDSTQLDGNLSRISVGAYYKNKFDAIIRSDPDALAFIEFETSTCLTYKHLDAQALELASSLLMHQVEASDRVLFFGDNSIDYFTSILAFTYLGIPFSPCKPANGAYETYHQLVGLDASIMFVSASKLAVVEQLFASPEYGPALVERLKLLVIMGDRHGTARRRVAPEIPKNIKVITSTKLAAMGQGFSLPQVPYFGVNPVNDFYVILYTSGTTGLPKGAIHTHQTWVATLESILSMQIFTDYVGCKFSNLFPFGHVSGTLFVPVALLNSMPTLLYEDIDHKKILKSIEHYQVELLPLVLELATDLYEHDYSGVYDLRSLRAMYHGGSKFSSHLLQGLEQKYGIKTHEFYGATEFMGSVGMPASSPFLIKGSVGAPMAQVQMKIVDLNSGDNLPSNKEGEICFRGPMCFVGYLNNPKATTETIDQDGWYHSGDVGFYDRKGRLYITDRIKELIKYKHWSIAPAEIESFLTSHEAVSAACVVGVSHATEGSHLRAYVKLNEGQSVDELELIDYVQANMGYQKRLNAGVVFVPEIPRSVIGKVERQYFKNLVKNETLTLQAIAE